jgi:hypothetical protein
MMKRSYQSIKIVIAFIVLSVILNTSRTNAQSLAFSQVILLTSQQVVPQGKVWKIENCAGPRTTAGSYTANLFPADHTIIINGISVSASDTETLVGAPNGSYGVIATSGMSSVTGFPLWLPAGTTVDIGANVNFISIIEFTVAP